MCCINHQCSKSALGHFLLDRLVREIVTFFNLWFDIMEENGLPFMENTANRFIPENMFSVLEKMANRLFTESNLFDIRNKTAHRY